MAKHQREKDRILYLEGMKKAKDFYLNLLQRRVIRRLKQMIERKRLNEIKADIFYKKHLQRIYFKSWAVYTKTVWEGRINKANEFYRIYTQRIYFRFWKDVSWFFL